MKEIKELQFEHNGETYKFKPEIPQIETVGKKYPDSNGGEIFNDYENNIASGDNSHAEGFKTVAIGKYSHSEGSGSRTDGEGAHAEGGGTLAYGTYAHSEGGSTRARGNYSHAEGHMTTAVGMFSHAEGYDTYVLLYINSIKDNTINIKSEYSIPPEIKMDSYITCDETNKTAKVTAVDVYNKRITISISASSFFGKTIISGARYVYIGVAYGEASHVEGLSTTASGKYSHAEGSYTTAKGECSHAEGYHTDALSNYSHAEGYHVKATIDYQHVQGKYNTIANDAADIIGWGEEGAEKNIEVTRTDGTKWLSNDVTSGGTYEEPAHKLSEKADIVPNVDITEILSIQKETSYTKEQFKSFGFTDKVINDIINRKITHVIYYASSTKMMILFKINYIDAHVDNNIQIDLIAQFNNKEYRIQINKGVDNYRVILETKDLIYKTNLDNVETELNKAKTELDNLKQEVEGIVINNTNALTLNITRVVNITEYATIDALSGIGLTVEALKAISLGNINKIKTFTENGIIIAVHNLTGTEYAGEYEILSNDEVITLSIARNDIISYTVYDKYIKLRCLNIDTDDTTFYSNPGNYISYDKVADITSNNIYKLEYLSFNNNVKDYVISSFLNSSSKNINIILGSVLGIYNLYITNTQVTINWKIEF